MALTHVEMPFSRTELQGREGFGIDLGLTLIKLVYTEYRDDNMVLHFMTYSIDDKLVALRHLANVMKNNIDYSAPIVTCGVSFSRTLSDLKNLFKAEFVQDLEFSLVVRSAIFLLNKLPWAELCDPSDPESESKAVELAAERKLFYDFRGRTVDNFRPHKDTHGQCCPQASGGWKVDVQYPFLLCLTGTVGFPILIYEDGSYQVLEFLSCTGKTFHGMTSLLTGAKSFSEALSLAENGDSSVLRHTVRDARDSGYQTANGRPKFDATKDINMKVVQFKQAENKTTEDFRREDLAAAVLSSVVQHLVRSYWLYSQVNKVRQVFFCGNFTSSPSVRHLVDTYFTAYKLYNPQGWCCQHYFLKVGGHLGALGALLKNINHGRV